ncbi:hypothetical protein G7046_g7340 [Stylonectria norvegica]|nr:hypothetical protein G7046_g7340 [Stylonectria norvegica]
MNKVKKAMERSGCGGREEKVLCMVYGSTGPSQSTSCGSLWYALLHPPNTVSRAWRAWWAYGRPLQAVNGSLWANSGWREPWESGLQPTALTVPRYFARYGRTSYLVGEVDSLVREVRAGPGAPSLSVSHPPTGTWTSTDSQQVFFVFQAQSNGTGPRTAEAVAHRDALQSRSTKPQVPIIARRHLKYLQGALHGVLRGPGSAISGSPARRLPQMKPRCSKTTLQWIRGKVSHTPRPRNSSYEAWRGRLVRRTLGQIGGERSGVSAQQRAGMHVRPVPQVDAGCFVFVDIARKKLSTPETAPGCADVDAEAWRLVEAHGTLPVRGLREERCGEPIDWVTATLFSLSTNCVLKARHWVMGSQEGVTLTLPTHAVADLSSMQLSN